MPEGLTTVVLMLAAGYLFLFLEIFLPGGVLGILGTGLIAYACYLAFELSAGWGLAALTLSFAVAALVVRLFTSSRFGRRMFLVGDPGARDWKAAEAGLDGLVGREGRTTTRLRPAGLAEIEGRRVDVVADAEVLDAGRRVRVCRVEGNRVVVEAVDEPGRERPAASENPSPAAGA